MPPVVLSHRRLIYGPPNVIQDKILRTKIFFFTGKESQVSVFWLCEQIKKKKTYYKDCTKSRPPFLAHLQIPTTTNKFFKI